MDDVRRIVQERLVSALDQLDLALITIVFAENSDVFSERYVSQLKVARAKLERAESVLNARPIGGGDA